MVHSMPFSINVGCVGIANKINLAQIHLLLGTFSPLIVPDSILVEVFNGAFIC